MLDFKQISLGTFLSDYWQKKPLVIRKALPDFVNPISADELAGLALEEEIESRIVSFHSDDNPKWLLKRGPFTEADFTQLSETHWTLLVQGVDKLIPEVYALLDHFNFIPQWRVDDVMISFASLHGSVGPHYDNYDVFLYQAQGKRKWLLTTQKCTPDNCIKNSELRIMEDFNVEEELILEEGDILYLPPHIGHYGISLSEECMTYSFGYRSYQGQELWDSLGDYLSEKNGFNELYQDPDWSNLKHTSEISPPAWQQAQKLLLKLVNNDQLMKSWFGCFATRLDQQAEHHLPMPLEDDETPHLSDFIRELKQGSVLVRDACCRFACVLDDNQSHLFINGCEWEAEGVSPELIRLIANTRFIPTEDLDKYLNSSNDQLLLYNLWKLQWLELK